MLPRAFHSLCNDLPPTGDLQNYPGVYYIVAADERGFPLKLNRVCGKDADGILYIGRSSRLRKRLQIFRNMICPNKGQGRGHTGAKSYRESSKIQNLAPAKYLFFRYVHCTDYVEKERKELTAYQTKFGEIPPLNFSR